jgi:hypothetical protein
VSSIEDFVLRGQRAQLSVDLIAITAQLKAVREHIDAARAWNATRPMRSKHVQRELEAALLEVNTLATLVANHFGRDA